MTTLPISPDAMPTGDNAELSADDVLKTADSLRWQIGRNFHEQLMEDIYTDAAQLADRAVTRPGEKPRFDLDRTIDRIVTSRVWGFPLMILLFTLVFWITISGANVPSGWLATLLLDMGHPFLKGISASIGIPWWLDGLLIDGMYLATAWVISVMLPPMAIFFPLFTCWRISVTCRGWRLIWTMCSRNQAHTASRH
jgi:ferrous iron transport protein B